MTLLLSSLDDRLTLKGPLGAGGMGEVHRAWDAVLERAVAVKFLKGTDAAEADRLLLEARLQARVEHPHVVRVLDTGTLAGRPCLVLQLVEGRTFADLDGTVDWRRKVTLAAQAARGLGAAHRLGLIHRDVKPANILVEQGESGPQARLSDFGLARDEEGGLTRSGLLVGTVDFMAPEQVLGAGPVDYRADLYGLGATLYAGLAGHPPFRTSQGLTAEARSGAGRDEITPGAELHPGEFLRRILEEDPSSLSAVVPGLPRDLAVVVAKAMEKDPTARYRTAEAFADDLERVLRGEPVAARRSSILDRMIKWARRNRTSARLLAASLGLLIAVLAYIGVASRRAGLVALENAQVGAEAASLEYLLRREYLLPAHDLRPVLQFVRQRMAELGLRKARAEAPRAYALGRGHQLLGEWREARRDMERARALGFRTQEGELAYGWVLSELYEAELPQAKSIPNPEVRKRRLEGLRRELLEPAVAAIRAQTVATPERTHVLLGQVAFLENRLEEAQQQATQAQALPAERAEGLFLEAKVLLARREEAYLRHAHGEALDFLQRASEALTRAGAISRSDPRIALLLPQCDLLMASHQRSLGIPVASMLAQAQAHLDEARVLQGDEAQLAILEATLLQRLGVAKKDVGQSAVAEDAAALALLKEAVARRPDHADLQRFLANAYYSFVYAKVAAGQDPGSAFEEGYQAVAAARRQAPEDWRMPYTGALMAQPHSTFLNNRGLDARQAAQRGIDFAEAALALGAAANALGIRGDCRVELAKAQHAFGEDPTATLLRILEDNAQGVAAAPRDQIMRTNAAAAAVQSAELILRMGGDPQATLAQGLQWSEGTPAQYLEVQRNRLDLKRLALEADPGAPEVAVAQGLVQACLEVERRFQAPVPLQTGAAFRLKALALAAAGQDAAPAFAEAARRFAQLAKEDPSGFRPVVEAALTRLQEARWCHATGRPAAAALAEARAALTRMQALQPEQPLRFAVEAELTRLEATADRTGSREQGLAAARAAWAEALRRNVLLARHPAFRATAALAAGR